MNPGTVLLYKDFVFQDGKTSPQKLILILAVPQKKNQNYLCCLATSKQHYKSTQLGCHSENNYYYIDFRHTEFDKNTWIVFDKIYEFTSARFITEGINKKVFHKFDIEPTLWRAIKNCVSRSEDVEMKYIERIKKS